MSQVKTTEEMILDAAIELFAENGYSDTGTKAIAQKAGLHESTLFRHFDGKKEIFRKAILKHSPIVDFNRIDEDLTGDLEEDLRFLGTHYLNLAFKNINLFRIGLMEVPKNIEFAKVLSEVLTTLENHLSSYLAAGYSEGKLKKAGFQLLAKLFYGIHYQQVVTTIVYESVDTFAHSN
ncbi:TetR/AcrR family transcriptional regulator [Peribacillus sp. FSL E2-0159]|uniref:TetR/AcrR family transcriptional regulator n=1 Tax=Peribacillus sp. FSL E2-0159 TaxID=2975289 RepID=UPI00315A74B0